MMKQQVKYKLVIILTFLLCGFFTLSTELRAQLKKNNTILLKAKETVSPVELNYGERVNYSRLDGAILTIELLSTSAKILFTNRDKIPPEESGSDRGSMYRARVLYEITADILINGFPMTMRKYIGSQESFYEPYVINGVRIWFDAVSDLYEQDGGFLNTVRKASGRNNLILDDGTVNKKARFVLHDMTRRVCPGEIHPWFKDGDDHDENFIYKEDFIDIGRSFNGDDCYLGAYLGGQAHGALDVNMTMNSLMYAPFDLDTQEGIRAAGTKTWSDGSIWAINTGHIIEKLIPDGTPLRGGTAYGKGARQSCWWHPHAHFGFEIIDDDVRYDVDPWIIFWQHFEDNKRRDATLRAMMTPLAHSKTGDKVEFSASCQLAETACSDTRFYWSFGDGGWSDSPSPVYRYAESGVYPVTLIVAKGKELASFTQHITVEGERILQPSMVLHASDEPSFRYRALDVMDIYSQPVKDVSHTLNFLSRPSRPTPNTKRVEVRNIGGGKLPLINFGVDYQQGADWLSINLLHNDEGQYMDFKVNGSGLVAGSYEAIVSVHAEGTLNLPQKLRVIMDIPELPADAIGVIVDDKDPGFYSTPYFWIGHRFHGWGWPELKEAEGYNNFYLINGQRAQKGEFARFTPDLETGFYEIWLYEKTPFASGLPAHNEPTKFQTRVVHADGEDMIWMEPERTTGYYPRPYRGQDKWEWFEEQPSRKIGQFRFEEGKDGFVEILADGSTGQVIVDAIRFLKVDY